ncbi:MAG: hypothetical protein RMK80_01115, partial [Pseudobdellovibrionaceae bacterium]|nr:hypothetical protein [Pseudobdellovibrionaceae bacterium]
MDLAFYFTPFHLYNEKVEFVAPLVLCSQSPRRMQLLRQANIPFSSFPISITECYPQDLPYQLIP